RLKEDYDGAEPSGNSAAIALLLRLHAITALEPFLESAGKAIAALAARLANGPTAVPQLMSSFIATHGAHRQVVIAGEKPEAAPMLKAIRSRFLPFTCVLLVNSDSREALGRYQAPIESMIPINGHAAAYVCENFACQLPVCSVPEL